MKERMILIILIAIFLFLSFAILLTAAKGM